MPPSPLSPSPRPTCRGNPAFRVEVDGDPRPDHAFATTVTPDADPVLGVCTGAGRYAELTGAGYEILHVLDADRDGRDELVAGGTWVSGGLVEVIRYDRGRLRYVRAAGGGPFHLVFGWEDDIDSAWGCRADRRDLVQVRVDWRRRTTRTETYALRGTTAVRTAVTTRPVPPGTPREDYAAKLATCPGLREPYD